MNTDTIRIDNDRNEIEALLGEHFLDFELNPVQFPPKCTVEQFRKTNHQGVFMLLTASKRQPDFGASVHITVIDNGVIRNANAAMLKRRLVGVQEVIAARDTKN